PGVASRYKRLDQFRRRLNRAYTPSASLNSAQPETIICRCEELTLGDLKDDSSAHFDDLDRLKKRNRIGMGRCQGRNCLPALPKLLNLPPEAFETLPRARPPIKPIQLRHLAADAGAGPAREPDEVLIETRDVT